jgi:hypothetical protein
MRVRAPLGLNTSIRRELSASSPGLCTSEKKFYDSHWVGGWVGQSVSLAALEKERDPSSTGIEPGFVGLAARGVVGIVTELCCRVMHDFCKDSLQNILHLTVAEYCRFYVVLQL